MSYCSLWDFDLNPLKARGVLELAKKALGQEAISEQFPGSSFCFVMASLCWAVYQGPAEQTS